MKSSGAIWQALFISISRYSGANNRRVHRWPAKRSWKSTITKTKLQKNAFGSLKNTVRTDHEWAERWNFPKARCIATWVGTDDFFFCHWVAEIEEDIMTTLAENGMDENLITVAYHILMHIDKNDCSGRDPYKVRADIEV